MVRLWAPTPWWTARRNGDRGAARRPSRFPRTCAKIKTALSAALGPADGLGKRAHLRRENSARIVNRYEDQRSGVGAKSDRSGAPPSVGLRAAAPANKSFERSLRRSFLLSPSPGRRGGAALKAAAQENSRPNPRNLLQQLIAFLATPSGQQKLTAPRAGQLDISSQRTPMC